MEILISVLSERGSRERNEDACAHSEQSGVPLCCVLSDGAGGHGGGDVASRIAVDTVLRGFARDADCSSARVASLITESNDEVIRAQASNSRLGDMRATLVVLVLDRTRSEAVWGHIGDSRLYMLRNGYVAARTRDHSLYQSMVDAGFADPSIAAAGAERSILIASLGTEDGFEPEVLSAPIALRSGDAFLLCSDGFWEHTSDSAIEAALQRSASPQGWLAELARHVTAAGKPAQDNYSAVAVWFGPMDFTTRRAPPRDAR